MGYRLTEQLASPGVAQKSAPQPKFWGAIFEVRAHDGNLGTVYVGNDGSDANSGYGDVDNTTGRPLHAGEGVIFDLRALFSRRAPSAAYLRCYWEGPSDKVTVTRLG